MPTDHISVLPTSERWHPSRAGIIGLWRYWDETFTFHRGRLLLRGPNGSGKSLALELLLPFLLDGDTSPSRLTSAARPRGRLFDRVMAGGGDGTRVGFAWVEFTRDGERTFTVGARIRASHATSKADVDLFTTTLAIGDGLDLLDADRTPLSRKGLAATIGNTGKVHDSSEQHRNAVREALFPEFAPDRYDSVITALLALRKEKLSQNLDLDKLSTVLSEALPPLDDHDVAAVAEGFERLDRRKAELAALERDVAEVRSMARHQRDYALAVVAGAAGEVRNAETRRDDVTRRERQARDELATAQTHADALRAERSRIDQRQEAIGVEVAAMKDSDAYREGAALTELRTRADQLRDLAERAASRTVDRVSAHEAAAAERGEAEERLRTADHNERQAIQDLARAADAADARSAVADAEALPEPDDAEHLVHAWIRAQRGHVAEVRSALDTHDRAVARRQHFDEQFSTDEAVVDRRAAGHEASVTALRAVRADYAGSVLAWAAGCEQLGADRMAAALPGPPEDPGAVEAAVATVVALARSEEAVARRVLDDERAREQELRRSTLDERIRWERNELVDPDPPAWRSERTGRPGGPLWRLVDVADAAAESDVDGLEAALTASGLVDAWVSPDGRVDLGADRADISLTAGPVPGPTLAALLAPASTPGIDTPVPAAVVRAVLGSVRMAATATDRGDDAGDVVIATDGTFRLGGAVGRGDRRPAQLLGAVARERHRLQRLAELDRVLAEIDDRLAAVDRHRAELDGRRAALDAELEVRPSGDPVRAAERDEADATARLGEARERLEVTRRVRRNAENAVREALRTLTSLAAQHRLPTDRDGLGEVENRLERLRAAASTWARRRRDGVGARRESERAAQRATDAEGALARARAEQADTEHQAFDAAGRVKALEDTVGVEYTELTRRIATLETEQRTNTAKGRAAGEESDRILQKLGDLRAQVGTAESARAEAEAQRDHSHRGLVTALGSLGADAALADTAPLDTGPLDTGPLDTATAVLAAARAIIAAHPSVDTAPQTVTRLSERVAERLHAAQTALGARVDFDRELVEEGWWVLRTTANGLPRKVTDLAAALAHQLTEGRAELAEEEERLFEQTLAGSVRRALADRIRQANELTDTINAQLGAVRTAAGGVQVRLRWDVDADQPDAVRAARALLLRDPADLSERERAALQDFVRARVDQARADLEVNAPWEARLRETLDYRAWHRFTLQLAHRDWDGFVPATSRRLQKLSTGERSIALHLPMIASVAAHYSSEKGRPSCCPRLILLDELFAGVDVANRAQLFGTFTTWDLDAVFTSDHEWCQYETLDGIAIHYLHPPSGDDPVTSTRFTWDGRRRRVDSPAA